MLVEFKIFKNFAKTCNYYRHWSADDFQVLHDAHTESYSILIDPNFMYENIYKKYLSNKKAIPYMVSDKSYTDKYYFYLKSHIVLFNKKIRYKI